MGDAFSIPFILSWFCMIAIADLVLTIHDWMTWMHPCHCRRLSDFRGARKHAMKYPTFRSRHVLATYALMGWQNNNECVNLSVEKLFHLRSQIHSSSLSVNNKITHFVLSALLSNTLPIKNLLSRVQESPDSITWVQVCLGVEGHVLSPSLVSFNKLFPTISQLIQL